MRKFLLILFMVIFTCGILAFYQNTKTLRPVTAEYTEGELIVVAADLNKNITAVTGSESIEGKVRCNQELLGFQGELLYYAGADDLITRICFFFPPTAAWRDIANRINEQLGETTLSDRFENGGAVAEWVNGTVLFSLAGDGKTIRLTMTIYYSQKD